MDEFAELEKELNVHNRDGRPGFPVKEGAFKGWRAFGANLVEPGAWRSLHDGYYHYHCSKNERLTFRWGPKSQRIIEKSTNNRVWGK